MDPQLIGAIIGLITATTLLIKVWTDIAKIKRDRMETRDARNKDSLALHDAVLKHEFAITALKDNQSLNATVVDDLKDQVGILNTNVVKLTVVVEQLGETMKELKNEKAKS